MDAPLLSTPGMLAVRSKRTGAVLVRLEIPEEWGVGGSSLLMTVEVPEGEPLQASLETAAGVAATSPIYTP